MCPCDHHPCDISPGRYGRGVLVSDGRWSWSFKFLEETQGPVREEEEAEKTSDGEEPGEKEQEQEQDEEAEENAEEEEGGGRGGGR